MSEIDEIFSSKRQAGHSQPVPSTSTLSGKTKKNNSKRKRNVEPADDESNALKKSRKRPAPETIVDPSAPIPSSKRPQYDKSVAKLNGPRCKNDADEDEFQDSRGSGPRRKTEEGWNIYKEDELGIRDEGGDTPLCPFDCTCCF